MSTKPMLQQAWATGELIDELAAKRQAFGYTGLAGSTPPLATGMQPTASTSHQPDDLLPRQPAPKTVQYQPPSFKLTRPTMHLTINKRIQVHHNYICRASARPPASQSTAPHFPSCLDRIRNQKARTGLICWSSLIELHPRNRTQPQFGT